MRGFVVESVRKIVRALYRTPIVGRVFSAIAKERDHVSVMDIEQRLRGAGFNTLKFGPFKGLHYPVIQHLGYASLPMKMLGTYERELHQAVERSISRGYQRVLNIGAADGYYACGYAYRLPGAQVIAWEMVPFIATLTRELAAANGLSDRVEVRGLCTENELRTIAQSGHTLVLSDCEGAEIPLLTHENLSGLNTFDMIIECHDHLVANATAILTERFAASHDIEVIESKALALDDVPAEGLKAVGGPSIEVYRALEENRLFTMKWIVAYDKRKS